MYRSATTHSEEPNFRK